jgi:hypothetical protein
MGRVPRLVVAVALFWACAAPAYAIEPLVMFLVNWATKIIDSAAEQARTEPPVPESQLEATYAGTSVRPEQLKRLIDESFTYLSNDQRQEIFDSLNRELIKPQNAAVRGSMIQYFADRALQVRAAEYRLSQLSDAQKESLAAEFGRQVGTMPPDEFAKMHAVLEKHLLPVPSDLNDLLLAQLERHAPSETVAAEPAAVKAEPAAAIQ